MVAPLLPVDESFEDESIVVASWVSEAKDTDATFTSESDVSRTGNRSISISASTPAGKGWPGWQSYGYIPVDTGKSYLLSAWGYTNDRALMWAG